MRARRGAVDFVGEEEIDEDRAGAEIERAAVLIEHTHAGDVVGQEVGRALQALEGEAEAGGYRAGKHGLARAGHVFDKDVPLTQKRDEQVFNL